MSAFCIFYMWRFHLIIAFICQCFMPSAPGCPCSLWDCTCICFPAAFVLLPLNKNDSSYSGISAILKKKTSHLHSPEIHFCRIQLPCHVYQMLSAVVDRWRVETETWSCSYIIRVVEARPWCRLRISVETPDF